VPIPEPVPISKNQNAAHLKKAFFGSQHGFSDFIYPISSKVDDFRPSTFLGNYFRNQINSDARTYLGRVLSKPKLGSSTIQTPNEEDLESLKRVELGTALLQTQRVAHRSRERLVPLK
jgi:hypothetical protein